MIKRTLYFGNPAYLHLNNKQLIIRLPEVEKQPNLTSEFKKEALASIPIEDIGIVVLDHQQITISQGLISTLNENNVAFIICDSSHMPSGLMLPLDVHNIQHERYKNQIESSLPLKKQLWQQTVIRKIENQAALIKSQGKDPSKVIFWAAKVKSGDPQNYEGKAAYHYWNTIFPAELIFGRDRNGNPPNNLLNYGYAILRAITARCLVGSGLLPTLGIHHSNKYNAYCLADDIMEPYRPFVDKIVLEIIKSGLDYMELTTELKRILLGISTVDILIDDIKSPLMVGMQRTTASLSRCFDRTERKISYPNVR